MQSIQADITTLEVATELGCRSVAFPAISTGVNGYPKPAAAELAVRTVRDWLRDAGSAMEVTFCCFSADDRDRYRALLG